MARIHKHHTYTKFVARDQEKKINAGNNGTQYVSLVVGKSAQSIVPINHRHMHGFWCLTITLNCPFGLQPDNARSWSGFEHTNSTMNDKQVLSKHEDY